MELPHKYQKRPSKYEGRFHFIGSLGEACRLNYDN